MHYSRRQILGSIAAIGVTGITGCLGDEAGETQRDSFDVWYPAVVFEEQAQAMYIDTQVVFDRWPDELVDDLMLGRYVDTYQGLERTDLDSFVTMYKSGGLVPEEYGVLLGEFDAESVADGVDASIERSDGYFAFEEEGFLLDQSALVFGADPWLLVDTYRGEESRATDAVDYFEDGVTDMEAHDFAGISQTVNDAWVLSSFGVTFVADRFEVALTAYFDSAESAAAEFDVIEADVASDYDEVTESYVDGSVIRIEALGSADDIF